MLKLLPNPDDYLCPALHPHVAVLCIMNIIRENEVMSIRLEIPEAVARDEADELSYLRPTGRILEAQEMARTGRH
jgi:hypothetical protein